MAFSRELKESVWYFARQMAEDGIAHRAQGNISLRQVESGLIAVTLLRLVPIAPFPLRFGS